MGRRVGTALLCLLGAFALSLAFSSYVMLHSLLSTPQVSATITTVLDAPQSRAYFIQKISKSLRSDVAPAAKLPKSIVDQIVGATYDDPRTKATLAQGLLELHRALVTDKRGNISLVDTSPLNAALHDAAAKYAPAAAPSFKLGDNADATVDIANVPKLKIAARAKVFQTYGFAVAVCAWAAAFVVSSRRDRVLSRLGRWGLFTGGFYWILFSQAPKLLAKRFGASETNAKGVALLAWRTLFHDVYVTSRVICITGLLFIIGAIIWKRVVKTALKAIRNEERTPPDQRNSLRTKPKRMSTQASRVPTPITATQTATNALNASPHLGGATLVNSAPEGFFAPLPSAPSVRNDPSIPTGSVTERGLSERARHRFNSFDEIHEPFRDEVPNIVPEDTFRDAAALPRATDAPYRDPR